MIIFKKKHIQKYLIVLSVLLLLVIGVYAVTSTFSWVFLGPPADTTHYRGWDLLGAGFDSNHTPDTVWSVNFTIFHSQAVIYTPHHVNLLNYTITAKGFPSTLYYYDTSGRFVNESIIGLSAWLFVNIFTVVTVKNLSTSYTHIDTLTQIVPLNASYLTVRGVISWDPSAAATGPFGFDNTNLNFSYTWLAVAVENDKNLTSGTTSIGTSGLGSTLNTSYDPPNIYDNYQVVPFGYGLPDHGIFFLYKVWSVGYPISIIGLGLIIAVVLPFSLRISEKTSSYVKNKKGKNKDSHKK